jgi:hypothetical protein
LAISAQKTLNNLSTQVTDPQAMGDRKTFDAVKTTLDRQAARWPEETDSTEKYRPCKNALERASYVAFLTRMKAKSSLDDKVWILERGKMTDRRAACERAMRRPFTKTS